MTNNNSFYHLTIGLPGSGRSEVSQGRYATLVLPGATNDYLDAIVTYVESWTTIHVQLPSARNILSGMQRQLQQQYLMTDSLPNPTSGSAGIMKFGLQNGHYRVIVIKREDPTLILVRFVDFGYTDVAAKQLIHPIPQSLLEVPAQAFSIRMQLKHSIAGSMSLNAFRKYMKNAQVVIQLGGQVVDNSFTGIVHVTGVKDNLSHRISEAIESKLIIKRSIESPDDDASEILADVQPPERQETDNQPAPDDVLPELNKKGSENVQVDETHDEQKSPNSDPEQQPQKNPNTDFDQQPQKNPNSDLDQQSAAVADDDPNGSADIRPGDEKTKDPDLDENENSTPPNEEYENPDNVDRKFIRNRLRNGRYPHYKKQKQFVDLTEKTSKDYGSDDQRWNRTLPAGGKLGNISRNLSGASRLRAAQQPSGAQNASRPIISPQLNNQLIWMIFLSILVAAVLIACFLFAVVFTRKWKRILNASSLKEAMEKSKSAVKKGKGSVSSTTGSTGPSGSSIDNMMSDSAGPAATSSAAPGGAADDQIVEHLGSAIGLMAFGSLKDDISTNIRKKRKKQQNRSRKHAGRSVVPYHIRPEYTIANVGKTSRRVPKEESEHETASSYSEEQETSTASEDVTSEGTENDDRTSSSSTSDTESINDDGEPEEDVKPRNILRKDSRKKETVIDIDEVDAKSFPGTSSSSSRSSNSSSSSNSSISESNGPETVADETKRRSVPEHSSENQSENEGNASLQRTLPRNWTDSYDSTQKNSTTPHQSELEQNSTSELLDSSREPSSGSSIFVFSNEDIRQSAYPYADSVHSSDFEIPSYLNSIPAPSQSHQSIHQSWNARSYLQRTESSRPMSAFPVQDRAWVRSEAQRTNSTEVKQPSLGKNGIHSEEARSTWILSTSQLENMSRMPPQKTRRSRPVEASAHRPGGQVQIHPEMRKDAHISSMTQLQNQAPVGSGTGRWTNSKSSQSPWLTKRSRQIEDSSSRPEQLGMAYPQSGARTVGPSSTWVTSRSIHFHETEDSLNLKRLQSPKTEHLSSLEEALKMKMNITLVPKKYTSQSKLHESERGVYRLDEGTGTSRSISFESLTTYGSTQDLSTILS